MRRTFLLFLLFILCFVSTSTALAEVQVRLRVIGASNDGQTIDPSLKDIYKELGISFQFYIVSSLQRRKPHAFSQPTSVNINPQGQIDRGHLNRHAKGRC